VVIVGMRQTDEYRMDLQAGGFAMRSAPDVRTHGAARTAQWARGQLAECLGFWVHLDVDVLDPSVMPAVDAPAPGGIAYRSWSCCCAVLVGSPECVGLELTVFDPDFDVEGVYAQDLVNTLVSGLSAVGALPRHIPMAAPPPAPPSEEGLAPVIPAQTTKRRSRRTTAST
jgi:arginase